VGALALQLEQAGWNYEYQATNVCPFIPLAGLTWEEYLGTLGSEHRYAFHRKTRRLSKEHTVSFDAVQTEEECREAINVTIELHNRRWRERGGSDAFHTEELVAFHRDFSLLALGRGWLRLFVLRLDGRVAACIYAFQYAGKMYFYQSGFEMEFERESVGLVAMGLAIRKAIEEGSEEFDLLHGNETYKSHWSKVSREIGRLEVYPPGRLGAVCRSSFELERASRRFAKRLLPTL
jgi:CelD/BcsL family acetyltransferase involved in cellulose biosynthesis